MERRRVGEVKSRCLVSLPEEPYALTVHVRVCEGPRGAIPECLLGKFRRFL